MNARACLALLVITMTVAAQAGSLTISASDMAHAPLVLGNPQLKSDNQGEYLCEATEAFIALSVDGAKSLTLNPRLEVRNPFGDRADCVAVDYSYDGAAYTPLAWVKSTLHRTQPLIYFDKPVTIPAEGKSHVFLRLRVDGSYYPAFTHFRWMLVRTDPATAAVSIDTKWGKQDFWDAFARANPRPKPRPAPHVLYHTRPLSLDFGLMVRREPVDGYVLFDAPGKWNREGILDLARTYEAMGIPFFFRTHDLSLVAPVFDAAPRTCRGLCFGEEWNSDTFMKAPAFYLAALDLARKHGRKVVWYEHGRDGSYGLGWWGWLMERPDLFAKVFAPRYRDTLIPLHENNDPRAEMTNLGLCLGLWLQGVVRDWGASVQTWWWNDSGNGVCETCPPELITRMMLEQFALGSTWFEIEPMSMFVGEGDDGLPVRTPQWAGIEAAYRLLAAGKIRLPSRDDLASLCSMGFVLEHGKSPGSIFDPLSTTGQTSPKYAGRALYGVTRYRQELIPLTPYGIAPLFTPAAPAPSGFTTIDVDGRRISPEMIARTARRCRAAFTSPNACVLAWREGRGYRLCLLHPMEARPGTLGASVRTPAGVSALRDLRTGEIFHVVGGAAMVPLSAKRTYRLLEALPK